jgi:general secretion pathway protein F
MPEFVKIHQDYAMEQPWGMQASHLFDQIVNYWWAGALILLLLAWSTLSVRPGRVFRNSILGRFFHPVRELRAADVLQKLGLAVDAGRPISGALSTLARYHFDPTVRHKLLFVRNEVEQGAEVWKSLLAVGLVNDPERRALEAADMLGNRPWTLDQLAVTKRRRTMRRFERLSEWLLPVVIIAMGAIVLIQVLSVMGPLVSIINGLT